jgi:hypothetical protein
MTQPTYRPAACIGSSKLPRVERPRLANVARWLERLGFTVRSGGARGSDHAFESGLLHPERAEIYLPSAEFNDHPSPLHEITPEAYALAESFHPAWHRCSDFARRCHARNGYQILGPKLNWPVEFVVCWTPGAMDISGTAQALRIARRHGIDVYNLADSHAEHALADRLVPELDRLADQVALEFIHAFGE